MSNERYTSAEKARHIRSWLYADGDIVHIHLVPGKNTVVPSHLTDIEVCLSIGYNMPVSIPDLSITETEVSGTLSFRGTPFFCRIALEDVHAVSDPNTNRRIEFNVPYQLEAVNRMVSRSTTRQPIQAGRSKKETISCDQPRLRLIRGGKE